jgi:hypothetical protein
MVSEMERLDRPRSQVRTPVGPATGTETEPASATSTTSPCPASCLMIHELAWARHGSNHRPRTPASARNTTWLAWAVPDQRPWGGQ